jgi:nucleotide-binding universal stress UspA family protein
VAPFYKFVNAWLSWLTENTDLDMLVMVDRKHGFLSGFFKGSHTQQLARYSIIPLLVFPEEGTQKNHLNM